jgi:hypothetical protein
MLLIRQAIREGWDTPQPVRDAIVNEILPAALDPVRPRMTLAAVRVAIDMVKDNQGGSMPTVVASAVSGPRRAFSGELPVYSSGSRFISTGRYRLGVDRCGDLIPQSPAIRDFVCNGLQRSRKERMIREIQRETAKTLLFLSEFARQRLGVRSPLAPLSYTFRRDRGAPLRGGDARVGRGQACGGGGLRWRRPCLLTCRPCRRSLHRSGSQGL